jgi:anti-anti-sigma factor
LKPVPLVIANRELAPLTALISLTGRLMLGPEGQQLENLTGDLLSQGYRRVIFDMSGITHIDSTGIGRCIACLNRVMQAGATLHMAGATGGVREGFRVTHLDRIFRFFPDVDAAQAAFDKN